MATASPYGKQIWDFFMSEGRIHNEIGVSCLMGNFEDESGNLPYRVQGDIGDPTYAKSHAYTNSVDGGMITEQTFVNDSKGYGLAQWTYSSRKQGLYNLKKTKSVSIADCIMQCEYCMQELTTGYAGVLTALQNATDFATASNIVLHNYESPADQSATVENERIAFSKAIYEQFHSSAPEPPTPTPTERKKMPLWFYLKRRL